MTKTSLWRMVLVLALVFACPCRQARADEPEYVWKTATLAPRGVGWGITFEKILIPVIHQCGKNNARVKIYWGGILGEEDNYLRLIKEGKLQGAGLSANGSATACPEFMALELPFLFRNYQEVDYVRDRMYKKFEKSFQARGYKLLLWIDQDFDQLYSVNSPLASLKDFRNTTFFQWSGPLEEKLFSALGAKSVPGKMNEIPKSVRAGKVESVIAPAAWVVGSELFQKFRYVNPLKIRYSPGSMIVSNQAWESIPQSYRECYDRMRLNATQEFVEATRKDNRKNLDALKTYGISVSHTSPENRAVLEKKTRAVYSQLEGAVYSKTILDEVKGYLKEFRAAHPKGP